MRIQSTADPRQLRYLAAFPRNSQPPQHLMPMPSRAHIIGLEPYYLAETLRDIASLFHSPCHAMVCHYPPHYRHVRLQLPTPVGHGLAHWIAYACGIWHYDTFETKVDAHRQVFRLGRTDIRMDEEPTSAITDEPAHGPAVTLPVTCAHGRRAAEPCPACEHDLPF